jgi:4-hydroxy-2-oxoheptanedioate aldolase
MSEALSGSEFKKQLLEGQPKLGLFLNSHSPTVAGQLAHSGYDWLLVDTQHGPMGFPELSAMLAGISSGGAKSMGARRRIPRSRWNPAIARLG